MTVITLVCIIFGVQRLDAVINNAKSEIAQTTTSVKDNENKTVAENSTVADSIAEGSEQEFNRKISVGSFETYGPPDADSYLPSSPSNFGLPSPVYGVPNSPSNGVIYPGPPPDVPPLPQQNYFSGPPKPVYGPPTGTLQRLPKPFVSVPFKAPKPSYGPPRPFKFGYKQKPFFIPKPTYGPPRLNHHGHPKPVYGPPKFSSPPKSVYGPPKLPAKATNFGGQPPHPNIPAPPTPPDIKYDGWRPIISAVLKPASDGHVVQQGGDLEFSGDFAQHVEQGAGGIPFNFDSTEVVGVQDDHSISLGLAAAGIDSGANDHQVVKSVGYEIFHSAPTYLPPQVDDSYGAPPANYFTSDISYASGHSYDSSVFPIDIGLKVPEFVAEHDVQLSPPPADSGIGLVPPSDHYGLPPSGRYGTPLLTTSSNLHSHPLNALDINPPKRPVIFREPVPTGLIQSIGNQVAQKDAHGVVEHDLNYHVRPPAYIPPPIPDITKQRPPAPSHLYSLPSRDAPVSFQNVAQGSSTDGLTNHFDGDFTLQTGSVKFGGSHQLTSYTAPLGVVDGTYGVPSQDTSDHYFGDSHSSASFPFVQTVPYDCSNHKSQPHQQFDEPLGAYAGKVETQSTEQLDMQSAQSQKSSVSVPPKANKIEDTNAGKEPHAKSLKEAFGPDSELVKSQSIDFNNIPITGALGTYTLQIQPADGGKNGLPIPHDQVLSEGLLQSILEAIEQPQKKQLSYQNYGYLVNDAGATKTTKLVKITPSIEASSKTVTELVDKQEKLPERPETLLNNDEIALYFTTPAEKHKKRETVDKKGSYVTHQPHTSRTVEVKH